MNLTNNREWTRVLWKVTQFLLRWCQPSCIYFTWTIDNYSKLFTLHLANFGPLTGGWVAGINDGNQYIGVNMDEPYKLTQIHMQGQEDEANWVTAFRMYFIDSDTGNWSVYQHESGEFVSYWN